MSTPDTELLRRILRTSSEFRRRSHAAMDECGYEGVRGSGRLLYELTVRGEMSQKDLAERLEIRPQSLTGALGKLEAEGYIVRRRGEKDKREQFVRITELGREQSLELYRLRTQVAGEMFACLSDEEKEMLMCALDKLVSDFSKPREE